MTTIVTNPKFRILHKQRHIQHQESFVCIRLFIKKSREGSIHHVKKTLALLQLTQVVLGERHAVKAKVATGMPVDTKKN